MRALGEMWMDDGKGSKAVPGSGALRATNAATAAGYVLGSELRACGWISASRPCWIWIGAKAA